VLEDGKVTTLNLEAPADQVQTLDIETQPEGAGLWLDSRWLGVSPLTISRPLSLSRLKVKLDGFETSCWNSAPLPARIDWTLGLPTTPPDSGAAATGSIWRSRRSRFADGTILTKDFSDQQVRLVTAYSAGTSVDNYNAAVDRFWLLWYGSQAGLALTTGVFVWMMFTLGDYLTAAQTPLP